MPNSTVTGLDPASALDGSESVYVIQGGSDKEALLSQLFDYIRDGKPDVLTAMEIGEGIASLSFVTDKWVMTENSGTSLHYIQQLSIPQTSAQSYIWRVKVRNKPTQAMRNLHLQIKFTGLLTTSMDLACDLTTGNVLVEPSGGEFIVSLATISAVMLADGWINFIAKFWITVPPNNNAINAYMALSTGPYNGATLNYAGDGAAGIEFKDMSLRPVI